MPSAKIQIHLDNSVAVYFPGQTVSGRVVVSLFKPTKLEGIHLVCTGGAHVHFTRTETRPALSLSSGVGKHRTRHNATRTVACTSNEYYFDQVIPLFQTGGEFTLNDGDHSYPFAFVLPTNLPTSFESLHGRVRYTMKIVLKRSWKFDIESIIPITVNAVVDLNTIQQAAMATEGTNKKTMGILFWESKPITAKVWVDRMGYVPGEKIFVNARVDNPTNKKMRGSKVQLVEYVTCYARGESRTETRIISEMQHGSFEKCDEWDRTAITVPPVAPSGLPLCNIIVISYQIQLVVDPRATSTNLVAALNIIIGNIPLRSQFASFYNAAAPSAPSLPFPGGNYQNLPPPSYQQTTFGGNIQEEKESSGATKGDSMQFNPSYVTYNTSD